MILVAKLKIVYSSDLGSLERSHAIYFLFQKVDVAANTIPAAGSESVLLVTAGLQICLQFDRVGARGVEVCLQTRACRVGGSYHSTHSPLLYNLIGAKPQLEGP